jgi:hypothetical protein
MYIYTYIHINTYIYKGESITPTERALSRVRSGLSSITREKRSKRTEVDKGDTHMSNINLDQDGGIIPFQLLPFFKYLDNYAQR